MRAVLFERHGLENLRVSEVETPRPGHHDVLVRVVQAGVNPIDSAVVSFPGLARSLPHTPGAEFAGVVEAVGDHVSAVSPGDVVTIYPRLFDASCDMCLSGYEQLCRRGGIVGAASSGGFAEYALVGERNVIRAPKISWDLLAALPVGGLTAYHALREAGVSPGDVVVVVGASGNTGMFAVQLAKLMGATVVGVSRKQWVRELGADAVADLEGAEAVVRDLTGGRMADVVVDPLGSGTLQKSLRLLGRRGRLVLFGTLTGDRIEISLSSIFGSHSRIIGTTGGSRKELSDLVSLASKGLLRVRIWRRYGLEEAAEALKSLFSKERDGRIVIEPQRPATA